MDLSAPIAPMLDRRKLAAVAGVNRPEKLPADIRALRDQCLDQRGRLAAGLAEYDPVAGLEELPKVELFRSDYHTHPNTASSS
jgi:hypothetical protein